MLSDLSHNENFANVVIESLAVGTPVLVSQYVGLSDYVLEKKLGWVCDTTVESLRDILTESYHQKTERRAINERSPHQIRQDFDPSVLAQRYVKMYELRKHVSETLKVSETSRFSS